MEQLQKCFLNSVKEVEISCVDHIDTTIEPDLQIKCEEIELELEATDTHLDNHDTSDGKNYAVRKI